MEKNPSCRGWFNDFPIFIRSLGTLAQAAEAVFRRYGLFGQIVPMANGAPQAIPAIIAYMIVGAIMALPYNLWVKRQMKQASGLEVVCYRLSINTGQECF